MAPQTLPSLEDYRPIVGDALLAEIYREARALLRKHLVHVSSTFIGGGVAEILSRMIPLMNDVPVDTGWRIFHGYPDFFEVTKKFHNALQGDRINLSAMKKTLYQETNAMFARYTHFDHDYVLVHDPQPLPLIRYMRKVQPWVWRCHVDLTEPNAELWEYLKGFLLRYDTVVVSTEQYRRPDLPIEQVVIPPAIDPLAPKNRELDEKTVERFLSRVGVPRDKPIVLQVARFDKWKDPEGVLDAFKLVREAFDCRLVLCGNLATDDPEGPRIYRRLLERAARERDVKLVTGDNEVLVNALQRSASVMVHKPTREGFGLVVAETLWKRTPVVASKVGGIPLQVVDGENGFLVDPRDIEGTAAKVLELLRDPDRAKAMGAKGREHVRRHFLLPRLMLDHIRLAARLVA